MKKVHVTDFYEANADIYAAVSLPSLPGQLAGLRTVIDKPFNGAVVELGAGIGTALDTLASLTNDSLYAVEPSTHMRVGLMTTVAGNESLRSTALLGKPR